MMNPTTLNRAALEAALAQFDVDLTGLNLTTVEAIAVEADRMTAEFGITGAAPGLLEALATAGFTFRMNRAVCRAYRAAVKAAR